MFKLIKPTILFPLCPVLYIVRDSEFSYRDLRNGPRASQGGSANSSREIVLPHVWDKFDSDSVATVVSLMIRHTIEPCPSVACIASSREQSR